MTKSILVAITALFLSACVTSGTKVEQSSLTQFHKGVTTAAQVEKILGQPQGTAVNTDGTTSISYVYAHAAPKAVDFVPIVGLFAGGAKAEQTTVVFTFGRDGKLVSYSASQQKTEAHAIY